MRSHAIPFRTTRLLLCWYTLLNVAIGVLLLHPTAPALAGEPPSSLYVALFNSDKITRFTIQPGGLLQGPEDAVSTGKGPRSMVVDPCGPFLYARTQGSYSIDLFDIGKSGKLTKRQVPIPPTITILSDSAKAMAIHPRCKSLYVPWFLIWAGGPSQSGLERFSIDNQGTLDFKARFKVGPIPIDVAFLPSGELLIVATQSDSRLTLITTDKDTGAETHILGAMPSNGRAPVALAATNEHLYVAHSSGEVSMFTINDASTGKFTWLGNVPAGVEPRMIRIDPKGRFAYVMDYSGNAVKPFLIAGNGRLIPQRDVPTRLHPIDMAFDFTGNVAYVAEFGNNSVQPFAIDNLTGMLTQLGPSMNVGGAGPVALVVAPTP